MTQSNPRTQSHRGSCHCGAVRFEAELDPETTVSRCNCSICTKLAPSAAVIKPDAFKLLSSESDLSVYVWGPVSTRYFCPKCGVYCFGRGHLDVLGGDYVAVNANCLDGVELTEMKVVYWDGRHNNWQAGPRNEPWPIGPSSAETAA